MEIVQQVPYVSQFASPELVANFLSQPPLPVRDDPRWAESGAVTAEEYAWWAIRVCGMACLSMVIRARGETSPRLVPLAKECVDAGGYIMRADGGLEGLIYEPFVQWISDRFQISAVVRPTMDAVEVAAEVASGRLVMISVHPWLRWPNRRPPRRGGHLVLAVGVGQGLLLVHNPSGLFGRSQEYARVTFAQLESSFASRAVVFI